MTAQPIPASCPIETTEHLREALLDLERSKQIEQETRLESEYILTCLDALANVGLHKNALSILLEHLKPVFEFEQAWVLVPNQKDENCYIATESTEPQVLDTCWNGAWLNAKISVSQPLIAFNVAPLPLWQTQADWIRDEVKSALHIALRPQPNPAYLICTHSQIGFFTHKHCKRAIRFAPMAAQALFNIESTRTLSIVNSQLHKEVEKHCATQKQLLKTQEKLVSTAREAGKAEIATNVVHNVGNVLNSVNVGTQELQRQLQKIPIRYFRQMVEMVTEHQYLLEEHEKMKLLPSVIEKITGKLETQVQVCTEELKMLTHHVEHISKIVDLQQKSAGYKPLLEDVVLSEMIDSALQITLGAISPTDILVERNDKSAIVIKVDSQKLLQILINLVSNARQALMASDQANKLISIEVEAMPIPV
ncbi:MAG: hypothetical protein HC810_04840 [Acaryochloridaceae cyanobacterium RL_2_7]|nr:hypothetical protein [Acaryochloridaceae cyanobacterium RL_2_7]